MTRRNCGRVVAVLFSERFKQCVILPVAVNMPRTRNPSLAVRERQLKRQREKGARERQDMPLIIRRYLSEGKPKPPEFMSPAAKERESMSTHSSVSR